MTEFIEQLCGRLAHHGFVGYAIDLFDGIQPTSVEEADQCKARLDDELAVDRLEDAVEFLGGYREVSRRQVGIIGLGFGGELALKFADTTPANLGTLVVYYAFADIDWGGLGVPYLGHYAEFDPEIPYSKLKAAQRRLAETGYRGEFKVYEGTEPSFFEDEPSARFDPDKAGKSWDLTQSFLRWSLFESPNR
jgi:dienelactone hydrolase